MVRRVINLNIYIITQTNIITFLLPGAILPLMKVTEMERNFTSFCAELTKSVPNWHSMMKKMWYDAKVGVSQTDFMEKIPGGA